MQGLVPVRLLGVCSRYQGGTLAGVSFARLQNSLKREFHTAFHPTLRRQIWPYRWGICKGVTRYGIHVLRGTSTTVTNTGLISSEISAHARKWIGRWLLGCGGMVFGAVVLGGVTRLTESGLSMVTWKLFGQLPPRTEAEWQKEFNNYQNFPEFKMKNKDITLAEFKWIWWMEYVHRMWGRTIGSVFILPAAVMWYKGWFSRGMKKRVVALGILLGAQGLLGWYMVKSGLEDRFHGPSDVPSVSQYRLASHLGLAFVLYSLFLWSALDHLMPAQRIPITVAVRKFRKLAHACKGMVFLTAFSGAFVAGLDAGLVYNSFPKMGDRWIPEDILAYAPKISNITENPVTVQFDHRVLGTTTLAMITGLWLWSFKTRLPPRAHTAVTALTVMAWLQVALGVSTLLAYVPTSLAATHQSGSLVTLSLAVWLTHELKLMKYVPK